MKSDYLLNLHFKRVQLLPCNDLRMRMKEDNPSHKYVNGDYWITYFNSARRWLFLCDLTHSSNSHNTSNLAAMFISQLICYLPLDFTLTNLLFTPRFYPALKTLEQLEHTYLPRVSTHWFSQTMAEAIPQLRNRIKEASMVDLKDFLENIRKHSAKIGEVAMRHVSVVFRDKSELSLPWWLYDTCLWSLRFAYLSQLARQNNFFQCSSTMS